MAAQTFRARGMSFPPDDSFGWLDDLYAVPSTGESDDGCLLFFDPKNARRIFYVHINRLLVHIGTFDPVHIGLLLSAKLTTAWTVQFHLPLPCRCRGRATGRPCGDSCWQRPRYPADRKALSGPPTRSRSLSRRCPLCSAFRTQVRHRAESEKCQLRTFSSCHECGNRDFATLAALRARSIIRLTVC
jgi:hypothetical protein